METRHYWEENRHAVKYETYNGTDDLGRGASAGTSGDPIGFTAPSEDEAEYPTGTNYLKKGKQDPMSHRIIEKRRRDRMNNCLADLSRLIPPEYLKKGRGRVEKTEIIEMAIRHLKFLQDRVNAAERQVGEEFRAGFQEAVSEAVRYLADVHGYGAGDGLCVQLASHLQRHGEHISKGEATTREKCNRAQGSSSETASSSSSSHGYAVAPVMIPQSRRADHPPEPTGYSPPEPYAPEPPPDPPYTIECDTGVSDMSLVSGEPELETEPLDGRRRRDPPLTSHLKADHEEDYLHSYKFKNSIERRFSRSQDCEATDMSIRPSHVHNKLYSHKRRRAVKPAPSTSTSASGSTEEPQDTSTQDTSSESTHNHRYEKPAPPSQLVPVFALNSLGKYYVPLSVDYACLARYASAISSPPPPSHLTALHPVTIHVNFQPCLDYHDYRVKRERHPDHADWRPM